MKINVEAIKALREKTSASLNDVRLALSEADGDEKKAMVLLKKRGAAIALKRAGRAASEGRVESYIHHDGKIAAIVEINCETDFVARLPEFAQFCKDIAMHIAAMGPTTVKSGEGDEGEALLDQAFVKDPSQSIADLLKALIGKTGENMVIRRFTRFALGEAPSEVV